ncbi:uncharacterized protein BDR25DRAFT_350838 [Lindgomyces ingoldianus]|uniref:Uncharacterized protein n=1 Tax=Lindgomyces ingoldianus TaxID=673940 RepID=A0ACB6R8I3_9PLEO|nr:uncharacterized protein BDR25DRAFT_350838 [Lindgomyces ingoldianus]KAF2475466.1 hypothetical protein BDR25DRAFT_350838 [Lindgomyces ingoldianus]
MLASAPLFKLQFGADCKAFAQPPLVYMNDSTLEGHYAIYIKPSRTVGTPNLYDRCLGIPMHHQTLMPHHTFKVLATTELPLPDFSAPFCKILPSTTQAYDQFLLSCLWEHNIYDRGYYGTIQSSRSSQLALIIAANGSSEAVGVLGAGSSFVCRPPTTIPQGADTATATRSPVARPSKAIAEAVVVAARSGQSDLEYPRYGWYVQRGEVWVSLIDIFWASEPICLFAQVHCHPIAVVLSPVPDALASGLGSKIEMIPLRGDGVEKAPDLSIDDTGLTQVQIFTAQVHAFQYPQNSWLLSIAAYSASGLRRPPSLQHGSLPPGKDRWNVNMKAGAPRTFNIDASLRLSSAARHSAFTNPLDLPG